VIFDPHLKSIYAVDSYQGKDHSDVIKLLIQWYKLEWALHFVNCEQTTIDRWDTYQDKQLPLTRPLQTDSTSCGIFAAMTAVYWIQFQQLPTIYDWTQADVPNLRLYMANKLIPAEALTEYRSNTITSITTTEQLNFPTIQSYQHFPEYTSEEEEQIRFNWETKLRPSMQIVQLFAIPITVETFLRLQSERWLNDEVTIIQ